MKKKASVSVGTQAQSLGAKAKNKFALVVFVLCVALYANTLNHGYAFDDAVAVTGNKFTKQGISGIPSLLTQDFFAGIYDKGLELTGGRYRPLSLVTFAIEYQFFGESPFVSHLVNILLYALTCALLYYTLDKLIPNSFLLTSTATLLFAAHPIHTEVVANIKSRDEILCFLFLILSIQQYLVYFKTNATKSLGASLVCYFLSLLSKENSITFLAILPIMLYSLLNKGFKESISKSVPFFITGFVYVLIRAYLVGFIGAEVNPDVMENPFVGVDFMTKFATIAVIMGKYVTLLFFPHPLSSDYSFNQIPYVSISNGYALVSIAVYGFLAFFSSKNIRKLPIISFGIFFYLLTISLVSNLVFNIGAPMGERFLFMPSLGFCLVLAALFTIVFKPKENNQLKFLPKLHIPLLLLLLLYSAKTISRNKDWKNNLTLFAADVKTVPNSAKAQYYYANNLLNELINDKTKNNPKRNEWIALGVKHATRAVQINPKFHHAHYALGMLYQEANKGDSSLASFKRVLELQPSHILTQAALGTTYGKLLGDYDNAIKYLQIAVTYNPNDASAFENLGIAYAMKQQFSNALGAFEKAMQLKPASAQSYLNLAITYQNMGEQQKAQAFFDKAFAIDPSLRK
ncbi:MAG: tetratricopeptide repeat protein [Bacteroidetes bacterium]|nr:tetratricopeptide repeat protein [Bacteroidota bacterium]